MKKISFVIAVLLALIVGGVFWILQMSHLKPGGFYPVAGLTQAVKVEEDAWGVPTLTGATLPDLMRAEGWMVARDRLFQMDLTRRRTAGKLAELFGRAALPSDQLNRTYGFHVVARKIVEGLVPESRRLLEAFSEGVNAFMKDGPLPIECRLIGYRPEKWTPADSVLVALNMFGPPDPERELRLASRFFSAEAIRFLTPQFGLFDAPIIPDPVPPPLPSIPGPKAFNLRATHASILQPRWQTSENIANGSNAWAIAGSRTVTGKPIMAADPHLHLALPNVWYRLKLKIPGLEITGVTVPGIPGILIGSNGRIAWTFTNAMADQADRVILESAGDADHYLLDGKPAAYGHRTETIAVKGRPAVREEVRETVWGPVVKEDGKDYALQWVALDWTRFSRMEMTRLNQARTLDEAFTALREWCGPTQNVILASSDGHIGWTIVGNIPNRVGFDGSISTRRDRDHYWKGYLPQSAYPKVVDPASGFIVSANQRPIPLANEPTRFANDWPSPARAFRLQQLIAGRHDWSAESSYQLQLDVYSVVHDWYRNELLKHLSGKTDPWLEEIARLIGEWDGKITTASPGYVFMRKYREAVFSLFLGRSVASLSSQEDREEVQDRLSHDEWVAAVLKAKPLHLLDARFPDYDTALSQTAVEVAKSLVDKPERLKDLRWGDRNQTEIRHPFSLVLPKFLGGLVNLPERPLPGSSLVPRQGNPSHGASMRLVVDLSDAARSIFNQPGGQSGYPLSKHYGDQFPAWLDGTPLPFEPGETKAVTTLVPHA